MPLGDGGALGSLFAPALSESCPDLPSAEPLWDTQAAFAEDTTRHTPVAG